MNLVNMWSTIGGLLGVLIVFPYINMKMNDMENSLIKKEELREEKRIEREEKREALRSEERERERELQIKVMDLWAEEFNKSLPSYIDSLTNIKMDTQLLIKIPVTHVDRATGKMTDLGYEYYIKINDKYKKIEER